MNTHFNNAFAKHRAPAKPAALAGGIAFIWRVRVVLYELTLRLLKLKMSF